MGPVHLVYQAYGPDEIRVQGLYAAYSALAYRGMLPLTVHIYTDEPAFFKPIETHVLLHPMSRQTIRFWRGPYDFTHRLKAMMIRDLIAQYPSDKVLYLDADTFFVGPFLDLYNRIDDSNAIMYEEEYDVGTAEWRTPRRFRKHLARLKFQGEPIDLTAYMWNAGAVGIHPAQFSLIERWIAFIDEVYPHYRRGLVEQYSISWLLQRSVTLHSCADIVFHYWLFKDGYLDAIKKALGEFHAMSVDDACTRIRANTICLQRPTGKKKFRGRVFRAADFIERLLGV